MVSNNVVSMGITQDYLKNKNASAGLAKRIEDFWHKKGHTSVKAWVETITQLNGEKYFVIRSNIEFKVPARD